MNEQNAHINYKSEWIFETNGYEWINNWMNKWLNEWMKDKYYENESSMGRFDLVYIAPHLDFIFGIQFSLI